MDLILPLYWPKSCSCDLIITMFCTQEETWVVDSQMKQGRSNPGPEIQ